MAIPTWTRKTGFRSPHSSLRNPDLEIGDRIGYAYDFCDDWQHVLELEDKMPLDMDMMVAVMRSPTGASAAILRSVRRGAPTLLLSVAPALECEAICLHAEHRLASGLSEEEVDIFLTAVTAMAKPVATHFLWRPQLRDAADEMVLETAVASQKYQLGNTHPR
jgi:predicted nucleic acid-binding protein